MRGNVRLVDTNGTLNVCMGYASSGYYFGDFEYYKRSTRIAKYQAAQNCTLFTIGYNRFDSGLAENDEARVKMMRKFKRRYEMYCEVKRAPYCPGKMEDYINKRRIASVKNASISTFVPETTVQNSMMLVHDRIWTDGEVEVLFTPEEKRRSEASARNAQSIMEKKMHNQMEYVYYNMCVQRGKSAEHDVEELPIEFLTQRRLLMPGD